MAACDWNQPLRSQMDFSGKKNPTPGAKWGQHKGDVGLVHSAFRDDKSHDVLHNVAAEANVIVLGLRLIIWFSRSLRVSLCCSDSNVQMSTRWKTLCFRSSPTILYRSFFSLFLPTQLQRPGKGSKRWIHLYPYYSHSHLLTEAAGQDVQLLTHQEQSGVQCFAPKRFHLVWDSGRAGGWNRHEQWFRCCTGVLQWPRGAGEHRWNVWAGSLSLLPSASNHLGHNQECWHIISHHVLWRHCVCFFFLFLLATTWCYRS